MVLLSDLHRAGLVDQVEAPTADGVRLVSAGVAVGSDGSFQVVRRHGASRSGPNFTLVAEGLINDSQVRAAVAALGQE